MTGIEGLLKEPEKISPVLIDLPNGVRIMSTKQGTVPLGEKLKLNKVLYVPNLNSNLVSVARMTKDLHCTITFFDDHCILQDRPSRNPIGLG